MSSNALTGTYGTEKLRDRPAAQSVPEPGQSGQGLRILLAMGQEAQAAQMQQGLNAMGFKVAQVARSGQEACQLCQELQPGLALLELELPRMDGLQAAYVIKRNQELPVVLMAGRIKPGLKEEALKAGVQACLTKPVEPDHLAQSIEIAHGQFQRLRAMEAQADGLRHEIQTRKLMGRASGILMERLGISHDQATARLHQKAEAKGQALLEVAQGVIAADKISDIAGSPPAGRKRAGKPEQL